MRPPRRLAWGNVYSGNHDMGRQPCGMHAEGLRIINCAACCCAVPKAMLNNMERRQRHARQPRMQQLEAQIVMHKAPLGCSPPALGRIA